MEKGRRDRVVGPLQLGHRGRRRRARSASRTSSKGRPTARSPTRQTGFREKVITETRERSLTPALVVEGKGGREYTMPVRARLQVTNGDTIVPGQILAKLPRQTAGHAGHHGRPAARDRAVRGAPAVRPRRRDRDRRRGVVRRPQARLAGGDRDVPRRGDGEDLPGLALEAPAGPRGTDFVRAGEALSDGQISPQDILAILGPTAVQEYLTNEVQEVYRLPGAWASTTSTSRWSSAR